MVLAMKQAGHRGYLVGLDLPEYVTQRGQVRRLVETFIDTGGQYYDAANSSALEDAYRDVSALESTALNLGSRTEDQPVFHLVLGAALLLLGVALALRAIPFFVGLN
jgi:hypothetical protein